MKTLLFLAILVTAGVAAPRITFDGSVFELAKTVTDKFGLLKQYVPPGETLEVTWTKLIEIRVSKEYNDPEDYIRDLAKTYKKTNPTAGFAIYEGDKNNDWGMDFIEILSGDRRWNFYRAAKNNKAGIAIYRYALRLPDVHGAAELLKSGAQIRTIRERLVPILMEFRFTEVEAK